MMLDIRRVRLWLRALFRPGSVEAELKQEVRLHVELETDKNIRAGMAPAEARRKAMVDFGGEERFKEQARDERATRTMEDVIMDIRYGFRQLWKNPGFTSVALISLALGIGANTAIFSIVNSVILKPLPFADPDGLVVVEEHAEGERQPTFSPRDYLDLKEQAQSFQFLEGYRSGSMTLTGGDRPERVTGVSVTPEFFQAFGLEAELGRYFEGTSAEDLGGKLVVLSNGIWQNRFGGDPGVVGESLSLDGQPHTVVGVAPHTFDFPEDTELWVRSYRDRVPEPPVDVGDDLASVRGLGYFSVFARLAPNVTSQEAGTEMDLLARRLAEVKEVQEGAYRVLLVPLSESLLGEVRPALLLLLGSVGLVLLIACANVANLLLARSAGRVQELAVRASLGASRRRLFRQLLVESILLGLFAGGLGLLMAKWGFGALLHLLPSEVPRLDGITLDGPVLFFTLGAGIFTGILFGLMPALSASKTDLSSAIKTGGRGVVGSGKSRRTRETLVVAEVALSVVLLAGAGLLLKSLSNLQNEEVGFDPERVLVARMNLPEARYPDEESMGAFVGQMLREVEALPGVRSAGIALGAPMAGGAATMTYSVEGSVPAEGEDLAAEYQVTSPDYFRTMGIPILQGRGLVAADEEGEGGPQAAVVSQAFAERHWGDESPLGRRISFSGDHWMEIVGVSGNVRHFAYERAPRPEVYVSYIRDPWPFLSLVVKAELDAEALISPVRQAVLNVDPDQPLHGVRSMVEVLENSTGQRRFTVELLGLFAALALGLALVGVYGVMAFMVSLRVHEISIRVALGAPRKGVLWLSLRSGVRMAVLGLLAGVLASLGVNRLLGSLLYGVSPADPWILAGTSLILTLTVLVAAYLPARRAAGLDPATVLRRD